MTLRRLTGLTAHAAVAAGLLAASPGLRAEIDAKGLEFFEKDVRPILVEHCYDCHSAGSKNLKGGLRLDSREGLLKGGDLGPAIIPGDPDKSRLIEAIRYKNRDLQMPPKRALSTAQVETLTKWVAMGAPDPREASIETAAKPLGMSVEEGRDFWSFKPVGQPQVPAIQHPRAKIENPIDAFHQARLAEAGLSPAPPADKRTVIRRATYDLTGLPPAQKEVEAFLSDDSPEAFGRVVDRLLRSPHYGIRWGRHWLDVARYADSNGRDENLAFGTAWRYRDYVVDSFNDDKPFDRFLIEQIAGDLLPDADQETRTATGFLQLGAKVLAEGDTEKLVMDTIDEQIDTLGKAFLGLTLGCARCHTHKFDPIMHDDYYALAAIFKSSKTFADGGLGAIKYWYEHSFATKQEEEKIKEVEKEIAKRNAAATGFKSKETARIRGVARTKAVEYLVAATKFSTRATLEEVETIARPMDLHPRILHHCRLHLEYNKTDPVFAKWHELAGDGDAIERHYRALFGEADAAFAETKKKDPKATKIEDERLELAREALNQASGLLAVPTKAAHAFDADALAEYERLEEIARVHESAAADLSSAMGVADGEILKELPIHIRGSHLSLGKPIARNFPEVLRMNGAPRLPENQSGRLELAQWMADPGHPLTARVFVNRAWRWHFGRGIVGTTENFGAKGDRPTHPELLDWLAGEFVKSGWSVKQLHRLIMNTSAYRMAAAHPAAHAANGADPSNQLWWRFEIRRLEAEEIRDSTLAVAGLLDQHMGGKTIPLRNRQFFFNHTSEDHTQYDMLRRRSLYMPIVRNNLCDIFEQFDFPDPNLPSGNRDETVVAPQALLMMNSSLVMNAADALADRLLAAEVDNEAERVTLAYQRVFARPPTTIERDRAVKFIEELAGPPSLLNASTVDEAAAAADRKRAWSLFCQSLAASNEFIYLN